ncbi:SDR family NAD(P)-dependent oxidoreductase [Dactylosporangium sp. NPDC051485]|uniref:SDR family NAD(P)-dependent oxidoreductase n=1 Tax=Dactylosporangium sp. NPDC051485 TaxID=3154846 RepID=UPI003447BD28
MGRFDSKVAIVTGAGTGIGRAEAMLLAAEGARVVVNDLGTSTAGDGSDSRVADSVVAEIVAGGGIAVANHDDVGSWDGARHMIQTAIDQFGGLDILINNAGVSRHAPLCDTSEADWNVVVDVNLKGTFAPIRHAVEFWRAQYQKSGQPVNAVIINTSSRGGLYGEANKSAYAATKMGVIGLTLALARELIDVGVRVNAVAPVARTRLWHAANAKFNPTAVAAEESRRQGPPAELDRLAPEHAAAATVWLATEEAATLNGQVLVAEGGRVELLQGWEVVSAQTTVRPWTLDSLTAVQADLLRGHNPDVGPLPPYRLGPAVAPS